MLHKESAIAVMVAVMLGAASLLGGLAAPALATHDPDAKQVTTKQFSKEDGEITDIGAIEFNAKKSVLRASGTITIEILQDGEVLDSATLSASKLTTTYTTREVEIGMEVEGSFDILIEYAGSGSVQASGITVLDGTQTAEEGETVDGEEGGNLNEPEQLSEDDEASIVKIKTFALEDDESLDIKTVEFVAKKSVLRASGTITVAIVQDGKVLDEYSMSAGKISTTYSDVVADFNVEVTGEFQVAIMYEGSGSVQANSIEVPGATEIVEVPDPDPDPEPIPDVTVHLVVEAVDQNGNKLAGLYVAVLNGQNQLVAKGFTEHDGTFTLDASKVYIVEMSNWYDEETQTSYEFEKWKDSTSDNTRRTADPTKFGDDNNETFTALYVVTGNAPPPVDDGNNGETTSPPPDSPAGTITVYAYRIPSEFWGSTFVSANAQMYFVMYNSTGHIVETGFFDETGTTIDGLNEGATYWIYPTDCDECHDDPHDVVFDHWEDSTTDRPRAITTGQTAGAYYVFDPDP